MRESRFLIFCKMEHLAESRIQQQIVQWYQNTYCLSHHNPRNMILSIPNGGTRDVREAMTLKATGLLPGASDLIVLHNRQVLWVEVKTPTGTQSPAQKDFASRVVAMGFVYKIVRSLLEFQEFISNLALNAQGTS